MNKNTLKFLKWVFENYQSIVASISLFLTCIAPFFHKVINLYHGWVLLIFCFLISTSFLWTVIINNERFKKINKENTTLNEKNFDLNKKIESLTNEHKVELSGYFWDTLGQPHHKHEDGYTHASIERCYSGSAGIFHMEKGSSDHVKVSCDCYGGHSDIITYDGVAISIKTLKELLRKLHGESFIEYNVSIEDQTTEDIPF